MQIVHYLYRSLKEWMRLVLWNSLLLNIPLRFAMIILKHPSFHGTFAWSRASRPCVERYHSHTLHFQVCRQCIPSHSLMPCSHSVTPHVHVESSYSFFKHASPCHVHATMPCMRAWAIFKFDYDKTAVPFFFLIGNNFINERRPYKKHKKDEAIRAKYSTWKSKTTVKEPSMAPCFPRTSAMPFADQPIWQKST